MVREPLVHAVRLLRHGGVHLSDRRLVKAQRLIAAAAVLAARTHPTEADLWPLVYVVPTSDQQELARDLLADLLARSQNATLAAATEAASNGPLARASRIANTITALLAKPVDANDPRAMQHWHLKLEGAAREIDASFELTALPEVLVPLRARLVELLKVP